MNQILLRIVVDVYPTENKEKVANAVKNIFGHMEFELKQGNRKKILIAKDESITGLTKFGDLLRRERIRDAARKILFNSIRGKKLTFYLNKQVACVGHISFSEPTGESPLGPIKVEICYDDPVELIDTLAPKTARK